MSLARCLLVLAAVLAAAGAAAQALPQMRATDILGREVTGGSGERLAIRDLVIDPATGKVRYLALGRPDQPRDELQLVPIEALRSVADGGLVLRPPEENASAGAGALRPALVE